VVRAVPEPVARELLGCRANRRARSHGSGNVGVNDDDSLVAGDDRKEVDGGHTRLGVIRQVAGQFGYPARGAEADAVVLQ
jgi:hypothetical protein